MTARRPNATLRLLTLGLAAGDALGSTSEFMTRREVATLLEQQSEDGWPFAQIGGGHLGWRRGEATDDTDMAMCIVRSFLERRKFDPDDVAARFLAWLESNPPDVGNTTRRTIERLARGEPWNTAGLELFRERSDAAANGSLMRNGVVAAMAESLEQAWRISLQHGIITHYAPLPVLCCAAQTFLIDALLESSPLDPAWPGRFVDRWQAWIESERAPWVESWLRETWDRLDEAIEIFGEADFDPDSFDPFRVDLSDGAGWCLATLQIGVWATAWALRGQAPEAPTGLPQHVFDRATGSGMLATVVLIGHDSDTYAATAGPMIAAATGAVPEMFTRELQVLNEVETLMRSLA